jgi:hypothetical protein
MSSALILNIVLAVSILAAILGLIGWAVATAHHDHHAIFSGAPRWAHRRHAPGDGDRTPARRD